MVYLGAPLGVGVTAGYLHRYLAGDRDPAGLPAPFADIRSKAVRALSGLVLALAVAALFTAWGSASLKPWEGYKTEEIAKRTGAAIYLTDLNISADGVLGRIRSDPGAFLSQVPGDARAILSLGPSTYPPLQGARENDIIIGHAFSGDAFRCGVVLPADASPEVARASTVLVPSCRTVAGHEALSATIPLGHWLTSTSGFLFLAAPWVLLLLRRWRELTLMLVPYGFFALYLALNAGIDRYGMPLYPFGIAAGAAAVNAVAATVQQRRSAGKRQPRSA